MLSRREFIRLGAMVGGGMMLPLGMADKVFGFTLGGNPQPLPANPLLLTKYLDPLPVAELLTPYAATNVGGVDTYDVGVFQYKSKVHSQMADTTVWGYRPDRVRSGDRAGPEHLPGQRVPDRSVAPRPRSRGATTWAASRIRCRSTRRCTGRTRSASCRRHPARIR